MKEMKKFCPFLKRDCLQDRCGLWSEFFMKEEKVGRCSISWLAIVGTETRQAIDRITNPPPKKEEGKL